MLLLACFFDKKIIEWIIERRNWRSKEWTKWVASQARKNVEIEEFERILRRIFLKITFANAGIYWSSLFLHGPHSAAVHSYSESVLPHYPRLNLMPSGWGMQIRCYCRQVSVWLWVFTVGQFHAGVNPRDEFFKYALKRGINKLLYFQCIRHNERSILIRSSYFFSL